MMFGIMEACLDFDQAVPFTVFRSTEVDQESGWQERDWPSSSTNKPRMALAELRDREKYELEGRERDADFRAVTKVASDVQRGDGIVIDVTALHHAGKKFYVLAVRDPEGQYQRLLLTEDPDAKFGT